MIFIVPSNPNHSLITDYRHLQHHLIVSYSSIIKLHYISYHEMLSRLYGWCRNAHCQCNLHLSMRFLEAFKRIPKTHADCPPGKVTEHLRELHSETRKTIIWNRSEALRGKAEKLSIEVE